MASISIFQITLLMTLVIHSSMLIMLTNSVDIGVCFGTKGNNLPPPSEVIALYKKYGIAKMRLFDPNSFILDALRGSEIEVTLGIKNEDIQNIAFSQEAANTWFSTNLERYVNDVNFVFIVVGNEVIPGELANFVAPAMQNLLAVLKSRNLAGIRVTTSVAAGVLQNTYPPSASEFRPESYGSLVNILKVLSSQGASVLMINVYPYFARVADPSHVSLEYALFTATQPVVRDGNLEYYDLFSAIVDAFYWAMEKAGAPDIGVAVSETGWPSAGNGDFSSPQSASTYNKNFVKKIVKIDGTPKRPGSYIEGFIFAMFNENLKSAGIEQNWGLFYPNKQPVYPVF